MADDVNDRTRVDELNAGLQGLLTQAVKDAAIAEPAPLFIRHANGAVFTRDGREMPRPVPQTPAP
jgi:hypothetical protein